ncbi:TolC family protein [Sulfurimonas marina]|uniref:TolC family protein n=1 Tax=Sulfurimonas marina TaxID=2590551 RepID=A0A7M1AUJ0_9BACT|nr:TolC family protein [Sulfurimonas marina]QOP41080.1 TolC family protein [Sulfurimonas marina]
MKKVVSALFLPLFLSASSNSLPLSEALEILKNKNLEIKAASLAVKSAKEDISSTSGLHWGKLDFTQDFARSNDAGNVFGFKLTSREANFGDFGFSDFSMTNPNILTVEPHDLNYPEDRNFFQSKLHYEVPIFTGFAISSYTSVMEGVKNIKSLDKEKVLSEKVFQLKKSYYDMALLESSIKNMEKILSNINALENTTQTMIEVGYAKKVDLLEVKAKKGNVERLLVQMKANEELLYHYISFLLNEKVDDIEVPTSEIAEPNFTDNDVLARNLDIKKATTALDIKASMLDASQASYYPTLGAFAEIATADDTFLGEANDHKAYTVGARLTWNIFNGGIDGAKVEKAKIEQLKIESQVQLAKKGISLQLAKIKTEVKSANQEIKSLTKELELANAIYENYEARYKEKLVSMNDVIIKQSSQIEKILQLLVAKNKRNEKIFELEKLANGEK